MSGPGVTLSANSNHVAHLKRAIGLPSATALVVGTTGLSTAPHLDYRTLRHQFGLALTTNELDALLASLG